jgi:hypothetical protein
VLNLGGSDWFLPVEDIDVFKKTAPFTESNQAYGHSLITNQYKRPVDMGAREELEKGVFERRASSVLVLFCEKNDVNAPQPSRTPLASKMARTANLS